MSRFVFEYDSLLRYRRHRRDLVRQILSRLLGDRSSHESRRAELAETRRRQLAEIDDMNRGGPVDVDRASRRRFHGGLLTQEMADVDRQRNLLDQQLVLCRRALAEADRDVRVLERLRERRLAEHVYEVGRREQFELEDAWTACQTGEVTT